MKVAIPESGNGALAEAFERWRAGHEIYTYDFPQFDKQIAAIRTVSIARIKSSDTAFLRVLLKFI